MKRILASIDYLLYVGGDVIEELTYCLHPENFEKETYIRIAGEKSHTSKDVLFVIEGEVEILVNHRHLIFRSTTAERRRFLTCCTRGATWEPTAC